MKKRKRRKETRPRQRKHSPQEYLAAGLGKIPDPEVCRKLGVGRRCAYAMRKKLGISYDIPGVRKRHRPFDWDSVDWMQPNATIAKSLGTTAQVVSAKRCRLRREGHRIPYAYPSLIKKAASARPSSARRPAR